jgi:hypothetical protein
LSAMGADFDRFGGQRFQDHLKLVQERELKHRQPKLPLNPPVAGTGFKSLKLSFAEKGP